MRGCSQPSHKRHSFTAACCPQEWRLDITLFVLLLAAFAAANALSLVTITFVGLGMALRPQAQQVGVRTPPAQQALHACTSLPALRRLLGLCVALLLPVHCEVCFCCICCLTSLRLPLVAATVQVCGGAHTGYAGAWGVRCAAGPATPPAPPAGHGWRTEGAPAEKGAIYCLSCSAGCAEQCGGMLCMPQPMNPTKQCVPSTGVAGAR